MPGLSPSAAPSAPSAGPSAVPSSPPAGSAAPSAPATGSPTTGSPEEARSALVGFRSPSGNLHCVLVRDPDGSSARCDASGRTWQPPPRPADCDLDWGSGVSVGSTGEATVVCAGDTVVDPGAAVLPYGGSQGLGDITCLSLETGVRCTSATSGRGFELSRGAYRLF